MTDRLPPRVVPTLTEVVPTLAPMDSASASLLAEAALAERVTRRVMERLTSQMELQLRERVAQIALEHTRDLAPRLQMEIESLVRSLVQDALTSERSA